jgi:hypothetical protein
MDLALSVPEGWLVEVVAGRELLTSPDGAQVDSRREGLRHMLEVGAPDENIEEMRGFLQLEGWRDDGHLPEHWRFKVSQSQEGSKERFLMREDGSVFGSWTEGLKVLAGLGHQVGQLENIGEEVNVEDSVGKGRRGATGERRRGATEEGRRSTNSHVVDIKQQLDKSLTELERGADRPVNITEEITIIKLQSINKDDIAKEKEETKKSEDTINASKCSQVEAVKNSDGWFEHSQLPPSWKMQMKQSTRIDGTGIFKKSFMNDMGEIFDRFVVREHKQLSKLQKENLKKICK